MNSDTLIRWILGFILTALAAIEIYYLVRMRAATPPEEEQIGDNKLRAALAATLIDFGLILAILYAIQPEWMAWSHVTLPLWARWTGAGLSLAGLALRCWAHAALGSQYAWYMRIQRGHRLVTGGPYKYVRHPMYSAALLLTTGIAVATANWLIGILLIVPALLTLAWRLDREEKMLLERFGDEYRAYQQQTGRLLPRW